MATRNRKKTINPRFSDQELAKLEAQYLSQLPTVAALLAAGLEEYDSIEVAQQAVEIVESTLFVLERQEADEAEDIE